LRNREPLNSMVESATRRQNGQLDGVIRSSKYRAYLRALINLAGSIGAVAAGFAVQVDKRAAYLALVLANALSFAVCAAIVTCMPYLPPVEKPAETGRWIALKDTGYVAVSLLDGLMWIQGTVLVFALPLWIVGHTHAPSDRAGL
jgi:hypothetical protein